MKIPKPQPTASVGIFQSTIKNQQSAIFLAPSRNSPGQRYVNEIMMWRSGVLILALSLACPTLGQQKDNAAQIGTDPNASHADQPPSPSEVVRAMGEIAVPQLPPLRPRAAKLAPGSLTNEQVKQLINQVAEKDIENDKRQRNYTYTQRQEVHKLDGKGQLKSTETETHEVMMLYGEQVERLVPKDDKPLC